MVKSIEQVLGRSLGYGPVLLHFVIKYGNAQDYCLNSPIWQNILLTVCLEQHGTVVTEAMKTPSAFHTLGFRHGPPEP